MNHDKPQAQLETRQLHDEVMAKRLTGPQNLQSYVSLLYNGSSNSNAYYDNDY